MIKELDVSGLTAWIKINVYGLAPYSLGTRNLQNKFWHAAFYILMGAEEIV